MIVPRAFFVSESSYHGFPRISRSERAGKCDMSWWISEREGMPVDARLSVEMNGNVMHGIFPPS